MSEQKQITYWYDGKIEEEETEVDMDGDITVPQKGNSRMHDGRKWTVEAVIVEHPGDGSLAVHKVYHKPG
jgi:hypothetical protein